MIDKEEVTRLARFEDSERPCKRIKSAGLITSSTTCAMEHFLGVNIPVVNVIETHVVHAADLWKLAQDLWRRACL